MSWPSVPSLTLPHVALSKWVCTGSFPHTRPLLTCSSPPAVPASCFCICPKNIKFLRLSLKPNGFREPSWIILTLLIAPFLNSSELQAPYQVFHTTSFDNSLLCLCQREYFQSNSCYIFAFLKFCLFSHNVFFFLIGQAERLEWGVDDIRNIPSSREEEIRRPFRRCWVKEGSQEGRRRADTNDLPWDQIGWW